MPTSSSESQPLRVRGGVFRRRNSLAWRILLPVPVTLLAVVGVIWLTLPALMEKQGRARRVPLQSAGRGAVQDDPRLLLGVRRQQADPVRPRQGITRTQEQCRNNSVAGDADARSQRSAGQRRDTIGLYSRYPFPGRKDRKLDEFQSEAWDYLVANPKRTYSREVTVAASMWCAPPWPTPCRRSHA